MAKKFVQPRKPPLGAMSRHLWEEKFPKPDLVDLRNRRGVLVCAIARYKAANRVPHSYWQAEVDELTARILPML